MNYNVDVYYGKKFCVRFDFSLPVFRHAESGAKISVEWYETLQIGTNARHGRLCNPHSEHPSTFLMTNAAAHVARAPWRTSDQAGALPCSAAAATTAEMACILPYI
jgi:hypothetical protein